MRKSVKLVLAIVTVLIMLPLVPKTAWAASEYYLTKDNMKTYQGEEVFVFTENVNYNDFLESGSTYPKVKEVVIAEGVTSFNWGFLTRTYFPNVEKVKISKTVTQITYNSINNTGLTKLKAIEVAKENPNYTSDKGCLFNKNKTVLIQYPAASENTSYVIPDTVTSIHDYAFTVTGKLNTITLGAKIGSSELKGLRCFRKIKEFKVSPKNTAYRVKDGVLFNKKGDTLLLYPDGKGTTYSVPAGTLTIGEYAFNYSKIKKVILPKGLKTIKNDAFFLSSKLTDITIPKSVTKMDASVFSLAYSLKTINVESGNSQYASYKGILYNAKKTELLLVPMSYKSTVSQFPSTLKSLNLDSFDNSSEVIIPRDLTELYNNSTNIAYPNITLEKGNKKFVLYKGSLYNKDMTVLYLLKKLSKQEFSPSLKSLSLLYLKSSGITELVIPSNTKFYDWTYIPTLKKITVASDSKYYTMENGMLLNKDKTVLYDVPNDTRELIVPDSVKRIEGSVFLKPNLTKIYLPAQVTNIYSSYLYSLKNVEAIEIAPDNSAYTSVDGVLYNKDATELIYYPVNKQDKAYVMPDTLKSVTSFASITSNPYLESITLSAGLEFKEYDNGYSLKLSKSLKEINVNPENPNYKSVEGVLYDKNMTALLAYPYQKADKAFRIPDTVVTVPGFQYKDWVFYKGNDYYEYTYRTFYHPYLETLAVGKSVKNLFGDPESYSITDFNSLKSLEISEENPYYHMKDGIAYDKDYTTMYYYPKDRTDAVLTIPATVKIMNYAFIDAIAYNPYLESIAVEEGSKSFSTDGTALYNYAGNKLYYKIGDIEFLKSIFFK